MFGISRGMIEQKIKEAAIDETAKNGEVELHGVGQIVWDEETQSAKFYFDDSFNTQVARKRRTLGK